MKLFSGLWKKKESIADVAGILLAVVLCGSIVAVTRWPGSRPALLFLFFSGAGVNINNGMKFCRSPKQKNMGYSMMFLGAIILILGFYVLIGTFGT